MTDLHLRLLQCKYKTFHEFGTYLYICRMCDFVYLCVIVLMYYIFDSKCSANHGPGAPPPLPSTGSPNRSKCRPKCRQGGWPMKTLNHVNWGSNLCPTHDQQNVIINVLEISALTFPTPSYQRMVWLQSGTPKSHLANVDISVLGFLIQLSLLLFKIHEGKPAHTIWQIGEVDRYMQNFIRVSSRKSYKSLR